MASEQENLRARLAKLEALFARAGTEGERAAAAAAIDRLQDRLQREHPEPEIELKFTLPDSWSVRLFVAVCRKHGLRPYRYPRQRRTTVMVRAARKRFDRLVWAEFIRLHDELVGYFEATVDYLVAVGMHGDGDDSGIETPPGR